MTETWEMLQTIEEHGKKLDPIARDDAGGQLTLKLLGHRAHQVYAEAVKTWPEDSVELVHDLRVATRRFREALAIASPCLDRKKTARADRRARKLGRVLGERRIADVMFQEVRARYAEELERMPGLAQLLEDRRTRTTKEIGKVFPESKLIHHGMKAMELATHASANVTLADIAGPHVDRRVACVEKLIGAIENAEDKEAHHELRIKMKRLRYSSEILREAYPDRIDEAEMIAPLKELQDALGDLNDAEELRRLVGKLARTKNGKKDPAVAAFATRLDQVVVERYDAARELVTKRGLPAVGRLKEVARSLCRAPAA